jgi:adenine-specific DNA-methyltransferase
MRESSAKSLTYDNVVPLASHGSALDLPSQAGKYPELRYMGSKKRLLPWIFGVLNELDFESAMDPFSGTGCVGYLLKSMDRRVVASDFLNFTSLVAQATIENNNVRLDGKSIKRLIDPTPAPTDFIARTFKDVFYTAEDLTFLDRVYGNIRKLEHPHEQALAFAALFRSCLKRQPRGVFTISGNLDHYDDGRRDLRLSLEEHFLEQIEVYNNAVFDNGRRNTALRGDIFDLPERKVDLVYLDLPMCLAPTTIATLSGITSLKASLATGKDFRSTRRPRSKRSQRSSHRSATGAVRLTPSTECSRNFKRARLPFPTAQTVFQTWKSSRRS